MIAAIEEEQKLTPSQRDALVHRVVHAGVGLARPTRDAVTPLFDHREILGTRAAVHDDVFDATALLLGHRLKRPSKSRCVAPIDGDHTYEWPSLKPFDGCALLWRVKIAVSGVGGHVKA